MYLSQCEINVKKKVFKAGGTLNLSMLSTSNTVLPVHVVEVKSNGYLLIR
jgi:hypothetical protein